MTKIITISREFGSGGRELGRRLADRLGIPFYDKELIRMAADDIEIEEHIFEMYDEAFMEKKEVEVSYGVGDSVHIIAGPLEGFVGTVTELDTEKNRVRVTVSMFGRETPVELELDQAEAVELVFAECGVSPCEEGAVRPLVGGTG